MDHQIFTESIQRIQALLGPTGLPLLEQEVLERLIHSSGDPALAPLLRLTPGACTAASRALAQGAVILTDTAMAAAAVAPMAARTFANPVHSVLQWAPPLAPEGQTRAALGMAAALRAHPEAVVLVGRAPTAVELLVRASSFNTSCMQACLCATMLYSATLRYESVSYTHLTLPTKRIV